VSAVRIDHVVMAVRDLDRAAAVLEDRGIATVAGGVHARWGTANRIAPLGASYLELLSVVDEDLAATTVLGRAIAERAGGGDRWFAVCLADDDIDATAARLGLGVEAGARTKPDGTEVRWRGAGIEDPRRTIDLPFFIAWETPDTHPGRMPVLHPAGDLAIASIEIAGDGAGFAAWTGGAPLPVRFVAGAPGVRAVELDAPDGPIRIEGAPGESP
jgi:catechol 2,3-dioxygenase-like lactoylglutathione lyase family enzyme